LNIGRSNYIVRPVQKAMDVLKFVASQGRELSLTEICYGVRLPKSTVFRYLHTFVAVDILAHDLKTDLYRTAHGLWSLGQSHGKQSELRDVALPCMIALRDRFNETVNLAQLDGDEVVYVEMVASRRSPRTLATLGGRDSIYRTAVGKAMLSRLPEETWLDPLPSRLPGRAAGLWTNRERLRRDLAQIRQKGYAVDREENEEYMCCFGAPICRRGEPIAAISLSAPANRLTRPLEERIGQAIADAASAISSRLDQSALISSAATIGTAAVGDAYRHALT
jgi:IclR family KDG regulon transcriptional repressor